MIIALPIPPAIQMIWLGCSLFLYYIIICNNKVLIIKSTFFFLIFQQAILKYCPHNFIYKLIDHTDELVGIALFLIFIREIYRGKLHLLQIEKIMVACQVIFLTFGLLSSLIYKIQPIALTLSDAFICSRFIIYYFGGRAIFNQKISDDFLYKNFNKESKFFAFLFFVLALNDCFFKPIFKVYDYRYFGNSIGLMFPHPTYLAIASCTFIFILTANNKYCKNNIYYIIMLSFVTVLTFRSKAIASILFILLVHFLYIKLKMKSKIILGVLGGIGIFSFGYEQLVFYFGNDTFTRSILLRDSTVLAKNFFPLGTGFGTFASNIAATYYSPLYYKLGYAAIPNMSPNSNAFLSDSFWPIVIGQTGFIGLIFFSLVVINLLRLCFKVAKQDVYAFWSLISIIVYELISSTSEPAFFNPSVPPIFFLYAIIISNYIIQYQELKKPIMLGENNESSIFAKLEG